MSDEEAISNGNAQVGCIAMTCASAGVTLGSVAVGFAFGIQFGFAVYALFFLVCGVLLWVAMRRDMKKGGDDESSD